jgi:hypothetical protein
MTEKVILKIPKELYRGNSFVQVLSNLIRSPEITDAEFRTFLALLDFKWNEQSKIFPSLTTLEKIRHKSRKRIVAHLKGLKQKRLIKYQKSNERNSNEYFFNEIEFEIVDKTLLVDKSKLVYKTTLSLVEKSTLEVVAKTTHEGYEYKNTKFNKTLGEKNDLIKIEDKKPQPYEFENFKVDPKTEDFTKYNPEAMEYAKLLDNLEDIKFYQNLLDKKQFTHEELQSAFWKTYNGINTDKKDGKIFWKKPGALFNKNLREILERKKQIKNSLDKLTESKTMPKEKTEDEKLFDFNEKRNKALSISQKLLNTERI